MITGTTVLVVDDHAAFRRSASELMHAGELRVLGTASDGTEAMRLVFELEPDIVLLDVRLPDMSGLDVARELASLPRSPAVVLISSLEAGEVVPRIDPETVRGFISKSDLTAQLVRQVAGVAS